MATSKAVVCILIVAALCLTFTGCSPAPTGSITVAGHYKAGPTLRNAPATSNLYVVVRGYNSPSWMSSQGLSRDTTCWSKPIGCPYRIEFNALKAGKYLVSMEMHDKEFRDTDGAKGTATAMGYYAGPPSPGDSLVNITNPAEADTLVIDEATSAHSIALDIY